MSNSQNMREGNKKVNVIILFFRILLALSLKRKIQIIFLFFLMLLSGFAEAISLASVLPFLSILTNPDSLNEYPILLNFLEKISFLLNKDIFFTSTVLFCFAAILGASIRLLNLRMNLDMCALISIDIRKIIYRNIMFKPYEYHIQQESSSFISLLTEYTSNTESFINFGLDVLTKAISALFYLYVLLKINWILAVINGTALGFIYFFLIYLSKNYLTSSAEFITNAQKEEISTIQEGVWGIKDVLLDKNQKYYIEKYKNLIKPIRFKTAFQRFIASGPRYVIEAFSIILIAIIAFSLYKNSVNNNLITTLGIFALGAQKLLPTLQQVYSGFTSMRSRKYATQKVYISFKKSFLDNFESHFHQNKLAFKSKIELKNIYFKYPLREKYSLENINFEINKGEMIGILGSTGSGKSTLLDILIGLLIPNKGKLIVDNANIYDNNQKLRSSWLSLISYVPQNIFLRNCSIMENIALTDKESSLNYRKVILAAKQARIHDFIMSLPNSYKTITGERGVSLSGGQVQRIGIARAIYKNCPIIVLDEATSALDEKTEEFVMNSISKFSKKFTIILVTHRRRTVKNCDKIVVIENGSITKFGKPQDIFK